MSEETGGAQKSHFMLILLSLIHFLPHATKFKYLGILFKSDGSSARMQITHTNPPEKPATDGNRMTETIDTSSFCSVTDIRRELWTQHLLIQVVQGSVRLPPGCLLSEVSRHAQLDPKLNFLEGLYIPSGLVCYLGIPQEWLENIGGEKEVLNTLLSLLGRKWTDHSHVLTRKTLFKIKF